MLRFNVIYWRNPNYKYASFIYVCVLPLFPLSSFAIFLIIYQSFGRILQAFLVGLAVGFSFWDVSNSTSDIVLIQLAIFMALILGIVSFIEYLSLMLSLMPSFFLQ